MATALLPHGCHAAGCLLREVFCPCLWSLLAGCKRDWSPWYSHKPGHPQIALTLHSYFTPSQWSWVPFLSISDRRDIPLPFTREENARGGIFVQSRAPGSWLGSAAQPGRAQVPSPPTPQSCPFATNHQLPAAAQTQLSSSSSERGQKSKRTRDTPTSAHQMGAGAGSVCWHRVTALPALC